MFVCILHCSVKKIFDCYSNHNNIIFTRHFYKLLQKMFSISKKIYFMHEDETRRTQLHTLCVCNFESLHTLLLL